MTTYYDEDGNPLGEVSGPIYTDSFEEPEGEEPELTITFEDAGPPPGTVVGSVLIADPENGDQQFEFEPGSPPDITQEEVTT